MLVLAAGAFAATGDLILWQVIAAIWAAYVIGDQLAFHLARRAGPPLVTRIRGVRRVASTVDRAESLLQRRGGLAVFLSHTVLSPTGPYVSYICGATGVGWAAFTLSAVLGAVVWTSAYVALGYIFATELEYMADVVTDVVGIVAALAVMVLCGIWLHRRSKRDAA